MIQCAKASQAWWNELKESGVANTSASANEWLRTDMRFGHFSQRQLCKCAYLHHRNLMLDVLENILAVRRKDCVM
ncbi:hypothetical protein NECAME_01218 [Necator americanus]|uniref:Uncharacterized protein n=1 Tax=Necator americanus TaxID=51031 RepID=W2U118_NECAM|nr:hypothetical protein NECAME_01218 [Necator americanus]ETN87061.1 hypothetical protein NECAME_01218 [Necator americanus]